MGDRCGPDCVRGERVVASVLVPCGVTACKFWTFPTNTTQLFLFLFGVLISLDSVLPDFVISLLRALAKPWAASLSSTASVIKEMFRLL